MEGVVQWVHATRNGKRYAAHQQTWQVGCGLIEFETGRFCSSV